MRTELDREYVISKYRQWLLNQPQLLKEVVSELRGKDLVCWCAPKMCHGDVLHELANNFGVIKMAENFLSPELRLVQGDCFIGNDKNMQGQPHKDKAGNPLTKWFIAAAGRKGDPMVEAFKAKIEAFARAALPQFFAGPNGACTHPKFSFKIVDGDGYDDSGKPNAAKPGFAGHWVFKFGSNYAPRCFQAGKWSPAEQLQVVGGINPIPRGDYIKVAGSMDSNGDTLKPGVYVNLGMVEWQRMGERIISGPDAAAVFGGGQPAPGYAAAPPPAAYAPAPAPVAAGPVYTMLVHDFTREQYNASGWTDDMLISGGKMRVDYPAPAPAPVAYAPPPAPAPVAYAPPPAPAPAAAAYAPPPAPVAVAPHPGILAAPAPLAPAGSALPAPAPAPTAAAPGFRMANPAGPSYESYRAQQWTDAMLVQNGLMVPA